MNQEEILKQIEEVLDMKEGTLSIDMNLADVSEYDSMAKLSLIVMADDDFSKKLTAEQLNDFKSVGDIINFLAS
jgi:acyl carrier protein